MGCVLITKRALLPLGINKGQLMQNERTDKRYLALKMIIGHNTSTNYDEPPKYNLFF
jgi:hypothetical protein